jgi:hypothetical protein
MTLRLEDFPREVTGADAGVDEAMSDEGEPTLSAESQAREEAPDIWPDQVRWMSRRYALEEEDEDEKEVTARPSEHAYYASAL